MSVEPRTGPVIEHVTRRLAECAQEFLAEPSLRGKAGGIHVVAVVSDLLEDLGGARLTESEGAPWDSPRAQDRNLMRLTLVACWLLHDDTFLAAKVYAPRVKKWLGAGLRPLAEQVAADLFVTDPDRREELARLVLEALGLLPEGENAAQASDRLKSLSSVERARVLRETLAQAENARKLRKQMEAEAARQAASRYAGE